MEVQQLIDKGYELTTTFGVKILAALAVFIIGRWIVKYLGNLTSRVMEKRNVDPTLTKFVASMTYVALLLFVILATPDNKTIIIPNAKLTADNIINYSTKGTRRADMVFGIGYEDDIDKARDIITDILSNDERVLKDPPLQVAVSELADSSVNFVTRAWVNAGDYGGVVFDATEAVKKRFDAGGISIPFPQRDVHLYEHKAA